MSYVIGLSLAVLLALTCRAEASPSASKHDLKILSFNFNAETRNKYLRVKRLGLIEKYITEKNPDVIAVQESWDFESAPDFALIVAKDLNMDVVYQLENGVSGYMLSGTTILAKKELHLRNTLAVKLPGSAPTLGDGQNYWVGLGGSSFLVGGEITLKDGSNAWIWTVHLSGVKKLDEVTRSFEVMKEEVAKAGQTWANSTVFFTGDMNSHPQTAQMAYIREQMDMKDLWSLSHPDDGGVTFAAIPDLWEYNPVCHGAHQISEQYDPEPSARIDYVYVHSPQPFVSGITRVFTKPIDNIWMSDHYGLLGEVRFGEEKPFESASADSVLSDNSPTVALKITDGWLDSPPARLDFQINTARGFTFINGTDVFAQVLIEDPGHHVYTDPEATIEKNQIAAFAFDQSGRYKYKITVWDYRRRYDLPPDYGLKPGITEIKGILNVDLP